MSAMKNKKCPKCGLVSWSGTAVCKRCGQPLDERNAGIGADHDSRATAKSAGWKKIKGGAIATAIFVAVIVFLIVGDYQIIRLYPVTLVTTLTPIAWFLAGVLEVATGVPFSQMSQKWDSMAGWQRGVIGVSVFGAGLLALVLGLILLLFTLDAAQGIKR